MDAITEYRDGDLYYHHSLSPMPDAEGLTFRAHVHERYELYYFLAGQGSMVVEGTAVPMVPGTCLLMHPGETHAMHIEAAFPYERMALLFGDRIFGGDPGGSIGGLIERRQARIVYDADSFILGALRLIGQAKEQERRRIAAAALTLILTRIAQSGEVIEKTEQPAGDLLVGEIIGYVNGHLGEAWTLDTLAAALYREKSYLNRRFKAALGTTIMDYANKKRLIAARQNLYLSGNVSAAFEGSGFNDYSAFWRQYKRMFGVTPTADLADWRRSRG